MTEYDEHIRSLRTRAEAERETITKLDAQVKDTYLKDLLRRSQNLVGDVETFFIRHALEAHSAP
jgi:vacuolar-type H+-ATPase subunit H